MPSGPLRMERASASPLLGPEPLEKWLGLAAIFMAISGFHQHFSILASVRAPAVTSALALLLLFLAPRRWRPADLHRHWLTRCVLILLAIAVVGVPFSIYPGNAFRFITDNFLKTLLLAMVAWAIARTPAGARLVAKTIATAGITAVWLARTGGLGGRLSGAYLYDANDLALIAVITIPLVTWWAVDDQNRFRLLVLAAIPVLVDAIFLTDSRSGGLGLAMVCLSTIILLRGRYRPRRLRQTSRVFLVATVLSIPLIPASFVERMKTIGSDDDYNSTSDTGRMEVWKRGVGYARQYPLLGVGIDNFSTAEGNLSRIGQERAGIGRGWKWSVAHNSFLQVMAELGFPAFFVFVYMLGRTVLVLSVKRQARPPPPELSLLGPMLGISWLGFVVSGFFLSFAYYDVVYVMIALSSAIMLTPSSGPVAVGQRRFVGEARQGPRRGAAARPRVQAPPVP